MVKYDVGVKTMKKIKNLIDVYNKTKGRFMSLEIKTSKVHEVISCKKIAEKDKNIVVMDRNDNNRKRVISKDSLRSIRCGDLSARV